MPLKLLIIHADNGFRRHLAERMRLESYLVVEASPEGDAVNSIQRINFDVVLLGMTRPHKNSLSLLKHIKEIRPYTEVILLTPMEDHSLYDSIQAMQLGAFDDLLVPVDIGALRSRIEEAYKSKEHRVKARRSTTREGRESRCSKPGTECKSSMCKTKENTR